MQRSGLFGVLILILVVIGLVFFLRGGEEKRVDFSQKEEPAIEDIVEELSTQLGVTIPQDVERTMLKDVSGGSASGLATRSMEGGRFLSTVLAALPDPAEGAFYEGWLVRGQEGEDGFSVVGTGKLNVSKGGYLSEFSSDQNLTGHSRVIVTLEKIDDGKPETHILEGSF